MRRSSSVERLSASNGTQKVLYFHALLTKARKHALIVVPIQYGVSRYCTYCRRIYVKNGGRLRQWLTRLLGLGAKLIVWITRNLLGRVFVGYGGIHCMPNFTTTSPVLTFSKSALTASAFHRFCTIVVSTVYCLDIAVSLFIFVK